MGARSRNKGHWFEREVAREFGVRTTRDEMATSGIRQPFGDLAVAGTPYEGVHIECKNSQTLSIPRWWREVESEVKETGALPILVAKRNGVGAVERSYFITDLEHGLPMLDAYLESLR